MTKQKDEAIRSLPKRLSNATLSFPIVTWTGAQTKAHTRKRRRYYTLPKKQPTEPAQARAWRVLHMKYRNHKIPKKPFVAIAKEINLSLKAEPDRRTVSPSTVQRLLGIKK
ncbi:MAG TPA: hypothetical protein VEH78_08555 [Pseudolabrys sp.]|nr:hypothetical protein [Pseudolabrys sp.]